LLAWGAAVSDMSFGALALLVLYADPSTYRRAGS
jgi:hypothetical protein